MFKILCPVRVLPKYGMVASVLLALLLLTIGCGGGGASKPKPVGGTVSQLVGPAGATLKIDTQNQEALTIPPGALASEVQVTLSSEGQNIVPSIGGYDPGSNLLTVTLDSSALDSEAELTRTSKYPSTAEADDPSSYFMLLRDPEGVVTTINNLSSPESIRFNKAKRTFTVEISPTMLVQANRRKGASAFPVAVVESQFYYHQLLQPERSPQIRPFMFRTSVATVNQAREAQARGPESPISGECWQPLSEGPYADGPRRRVAVLVHGINNRINNLSILAYYLSHLRDDQSNLFYDEVWGIDHDWQGSIGPRGDQLAELVNARLGGKSTKLDIFAHSQGTLVSRYAIEKSGGNAKSHIARAFLLAPMNNGVPIKLENVGRLLASGFGFPLGYIGVKEMLRHPEELFKGWWYLLDGLVHSGSQGTVDYYALTGGDPGTYEGGRMSIMYGNEEHDGIVPWASSKYKPDEHANHWTQLPGAAGASHFSINHSSLSGRFLGQNASALNLDSDLMNTDSVYAAFTKTILGSDSGIFASFEMSSHVIEAGGSNPWSYQFKIRNNGQDTLLLKDLAFETYDRNGDYFATQWFQEGADPFPFSHVLINDNIQPGGAITFNIRTNPNGPHFERLFAETIRLKAGLRNNSEGKDSTLVATLVLTREGIFPESPNQFQMLAASQPKATYATSGQLGGSRGPSGR